MTINRKLENGNGAQIKNKKIIYFKLVILNYKMNKIIVRFMKQMMKIINIKLNKIKMKMKIILKIKIRIIKGMQILIILMLSVMKSIQLIQKKMKMNKQNKKFQIIKRNVNCI